jgi:hypothetical protein
MIFKGCQINVNPFINNIVLRRAAIFVMIKKIHLEE